MIIAIDGPAASGKGTLARSLAERFGLPHLDTGLLYRAVGRRLLDQDAELVDEIVAGAAARALSLDWLADQRLRSAEAGKAASIVAALPAVRLALRQFQVDFAHQDGGAVLDGRDVGAVIAPDADLKIWVTAAPQVRARRRYLELSAAGSAISEAQLLEDLQARDAKDAPNMTPAADAVLLDTSELDREGALAAALALAEARRVSSHRGR